MNATKSLSSKWWSSYLLAFCILCLLGMSVYWNSLGNPFQYDDQHAVQNNVNIRSIKNIPYFFSNRLATYGNAHNLHHYRPLLAAGYAINYALGGLNPVGYHAANLVFHVGTAFLLFLIVKALLESRLIGRRLKAEVRSKKLEERNGGIEFFAALAAGLIFLVHPFNSEAVNYITARSSLMSGFFYLLGFWCWVRYRQLAVSSEQLAVTAHCSLFTANYYIASLLAFIAGMLSKEVVITLPIVCFLYDLYFFSPRQVAVSSKQLADKSAYCSPLTASGLLNWRTYIPYLPFVFIVFISYLFIRASSFGGALPHFQRDVWTQMFTELPVLVKHLQMFFIPHPLTIFHAIDIYKTFWSPPVIYSVFILTAYIIISVLLYRTRIHACRITSFFMLWFFIVLLPTTVIPLSYIFQENRGYMAIVSFAAFAGITIGEIQKRWIKNWVVLLLIMLVILYSWGVVQRNKIWKDELTLWTDAVQNAPHSSTVYTILGEAYRKTGLYEKAIEASNKALLIGGETDYIVHETLGRVYWAQKKWDLSTQELEMAIKQYPYKAETHNNLGAVYYQMEKLDLAEREFKEAIKIDNRSYRSYIGLGLLYTSLGRVEDGIKAYQIALMLNPHDLWVRLKMGILMERITKNSEAAEQYRIVVQQAGRGDSTLVEEAGRRLQKMKEPLPPLEKGRNTVK